MPAFAVTPPRELALIGERERGKRARGEREGGGSSRSQSRSSFFSLVRPIQQRTAPLRSALLSPFSSPDSDTRPSVCCLWRCSARRGCIRGPRRPTPARIPRRRRPSSLVLGLASSPRPRRSAFLLFSMRNRLAQAGRAYYIVTKGAFCKGDWRGTDRESGARKRFGRSLRR